MKGQLPLPLTPDDLENMPGVHETRVSYDHHAYGRYSVWVTGSGEYGYTVVCDFGEEGKADPLTPLLSRASALDKVAGLVRRYGAGGYRLTTDDWE